MDNITLFWDRSPFDWPCPQYVVIPTEKDAGNPLAAAFGQVYAPTALRLSNRACIIILRRPSQAEKRALYAWQLARDVLHHPGDPRHSSTMGGARRGNCHRDDVPARNYDAYHRFSLDRRRQPEPPSS